MKTWKIFAKINCLSIQIYELALFISLQAVHADEPRCLSRFDHDFKVAKKLAELERELEEQKKAVQKLTKECDGMFDIYMFNK